MAKQNPNEVFTSDYRNTDGRLLGSLTAMFYGLFTLLPDSTSLVLSWPWVFLWQVALICPIVWLLWVVGHQHRERLGNGLDWIAGLLVLGSLLSAVFAEFAVQARWYIWAGLGFLAALYALNQCLQSSEQRFKLLLWQGYLNLAFIAVSLSLWISQTFIPEIVRLRSLQQYGVHLSFDFSILELRNWAPIGHQNYVAGYLVLALPLLVGLSFLQSGKQRWLWIAGVGFGLVDLYTTSSRGGWLSLLTLSFVSISILLFRSSLPRRWLGLGSVGILAVLTLFLLANQRLLTSIQAILSGQAGGELAYRLITSTTGWQMGLSHPWLGAGPGSVPLLYQKYRPVWAGREAELAYQLHNTPAQIWAELGLWGIGTLVAAIALLSYLGWRWLQITDTNSTATTRADRVLVGSIYAGLLGYGIISLTDYQLDNICISGTLVIFLAVVASAFRAVLTPQSETQDLAVPMHHRLTQGLVWGGTGLLVAIAFWLAPIHWAWKSSSQGFTALARQDISTFVQSLSRAHQLAPWESYYSYQLGWNLGNLGLQTLDIAQRQQLFNDGITWLRKGIEASPYQEFGHSNLAWLLLNRDPKAASQEFVRSAQLVPAKRGVFYGLGLSLLAQEKSDLGIEAIALEVIRDPLLITSPIWNSSDLQPIYQQVTDRMEAHYKTLLEQSSTDTDLTTYLHQSRGGLLWWLGNLEAARTDLESYGSDLSKLVLDLSQGKPIQTQIQQLPTSPGKLAIVAWLNPTQRTALLQQAWVTNTRQAPSDQLLEQLLATMNNSATFDQWLKQNAPQRSYRRERAGFGVLNRHIDGPQPSDFLTIVENSTINTFFKDLFPSPFYDPNLDRALNKERASVLASNFNN
jgi:uncharacterized protein involved in response to NO